MKLQLRDLRLRKVVLRAPPLHLKKTVLRKLKANQQKENDKHESEEEEIIDTSTKKRPQVRELGKRTWVAGMILNLIKIISIL